MWPMLMRGGGAGLANVLGASTSRDCWNLLLELKSSWIPLSHLLSHAWERRSEFCVFPLTQVIVWGLQIVSTYVSPFLSGTLLNVPQYFSAIITRNHQMTFTLTLSSHNFAACLSPLGHTYTHTLSPSLIHPSNSSLCIIHSLQSTSANLPSPPM